MIVVLGRPRVYRPQPDGPLAPGGLAAEIALSIGRAGVAVEMVGSIGDDPEGDTIVVDLGRAGVGHAALLRDPAAHTPTFRSDPALLPRLEAADVELGLRYVPECRVLVIAAVLDAEALAQTIASADYHSAAVVVVAPAGSIDAESLSDGVTLLERPAPEDEDEDDLPDEGVVAADDAAFGAFVAEYAVRLDQGEAPAKAFAAALGDSAWEPSAD